ncbi:MAG: hypothetical protein K6A94_02965 [Bacteroidales bacterium]|nr:hypothetical protein [Bacteroidales bacterium]
MSETYNYEEGAIHNDHKKVIHIDNVGSNDIGKVIKAFFDDEAEDAENVEEVGIDAPSSASDSEQIEQEEPNYFQPTRHLKDLLKQDWFKELRSNDKYDEAWTDAFVEALMETEWKTVIAKDWAIKGKREKKNQIKGYVVGLLAKEKVLKGSYDSIAVQAGVTDAPRTFSRYMSEGSRQPYADWVKDYITNN